MTIEQLQKRNRFVTDFEVISKIGEGSFGEAFKVRAKDDDFGLYAVKKAKEQYLGFKDRDQKLSEVHKALKITNLQHRLRGLEPSTISFQDFCVKTYEAWEESGYLFIRSELCEQGNLNDYLVELEKKSETELLKEEDIWRFLFQMSCAVKHVHMCGFVHLDIKPSNFFVTSTGQLKLGDFGQAVELDTLSGIKDDDMEGDSVYMAPELLKSNIPV